jgi:hypothetical protein
MLTIVNINKLVNQKIWDGWEVREILEGTHNATYIFELAKYRAHIGYATEKCIIMLERTGHTHHTYGHPHSDKLTYFFIYNSQRTDVCATADWLADKDNMIAKLEYILVNKENLL